MESDQPSKYHVLLTPSARRDLKRIPQHEIEHVDQAILALEDNPRHDGVKQLSQAGGLHRVRARRYRVIFRINDDQKIVEVARVRHRKDAYKP